MRTGHPHGPPAHPRDHHPGKVSALAATVAEWDRDVALYTDVFLDHPGVWEARKTVLLRNGPEAGTTREAAWSEKDRLTWAESVATPAHPDIAPRPGLRRGLPGLSQGHAARRDPRSLRRRTVPPEQSAPLGGGEPEATRAAAEAATAVPPPDGLRAGGAGVLGRLPPGFCAPVQAPPYLDAMLQDCDREPGRIAAARAEQEGRMAAEGREGRTGQQPVNERQTGDGCRRGLVPCGLARQGQPAVGLVAGGREGAWAEKRTAPRCRRAVAFG